VLDPPLALHICGTPSAPRSTLPLVARELRSLGARVTLGGSVATSLRCQPDYLLVFGAWDAASESVRSQARAAGVPEVNESRLLTLLGVHEAEPSAELLRLLSPAPAAAPRRASGGGRGAAAGSSDGTLNIFQLLLLNQYGKPLVTNRKMAAGLAREAVLAAAAKAHWRAAGRAPLVANDRFGSPLYLAVHADAMLAEMNDVLCAQHAMHC